MYTANVKFEVIPQEPSDGKVRLKVIPHFEGMVDRQHHQQVLTAIAVNCVKQLGLIQGMEAAMEEVSKLAYETKFKALPQITYISEMGVAEEEPSDDE